MIYINENGLYKCLCPEKYHSKAYLYHCRNWTFIPEIFEGRVFMIDTYYKSWDTRIEITKDNIDDFQFIFDFNEVKRIYDWEVDEYEESDLYMVATNSGGYNCGNLHWVNKTAIKSKNKLRKKSLRKIEQLNRDLVWEKRKLEEMEKE